ncbi:MAG: M56 family metallopeptidase [Emcibacter sp.]|nr:M56 family metallopeptidase [Emcibacter sp.]
MGQIIFDSMGMIAVQHLWQSVFCLTIVMLLMRVTPGMTSELRSWLWLTAFIMAAFMPFMVFLPPLGEGAMLTGVLAEIIISESVSHVGQGTEIAPMPLYYWVCLIWIAGVMVQLIRFGRSAFHTATIIKAVRPLPRHMARFARLLDRKIPVYCSDQITSPMVTGFRQQIILLPDHIIAQLDTADFFNILAHEYGHIHRNDVRIMVLQKILSTVFWWNPVLHRIVENLNEAREMACDERAVITTGGVQQYTRSLLSSAEKMLQTQSSPLAASIFNSRKTLTQRIERLRNMNITMIKQGKRATILWSVGMVFLATSAAYILTPRLALADKPPGVENKGGYVSPILNFLEALPVYPMQAVEQKLEGHVVLKFDVAIDGSTTKHSIQESSDEIFNESALEAARKFIYKPQPDGIAVMDVLYRINFKLN